MAILVDQEAAKIIELLEELRRDVPTIRKRADHDAAAMSAAADPQALPMQSRFARGHGEARSRDAREQHQAMKYPRVNPSGEMQLRTELRKVDEKQTPKTA